MDQAPKSRGSKLYGLLVILPFATVLWVPFYNRVEPEFFGIPFFYWYQLLWIPLGAVLLLPAYLSSRRRGSR